MSGFDQTDDLLLRDWRPRSQLRLVGTEVPRPAVGVVDAHNHLGRWLTDGDWMIDDVAGLVAMMDECGVELIVNLDGMWGDEVTANVDRYDRAHPGRFRTFCQLDWALVTEPDGVRRLIASLEDSVRRGARGLKIWKNLGLTVREETADGAPGRYVLPDDPRVVRVVTRAGELGLPTLVHTADPMAFFTPVDPFNERVDELLAHPDWWFGGPGVPGFDELLDSHATLVLACPGTSFIGAHAGCAAEDLDRVERLLDAAPHYSIDIGGRMAELGRQPRRFARLLAAHPDRVLFGTDAFPVSAEQYRVHFRFCETADESFSYDPGYDIPRQGRWTVSGLDLAEAQLAALYRDNAARVLGLD